MHVASAVEEYVLDIAEATRIGGPSSRRRSRHQPTSDAGVARRARRDVPRRWGARYVTPDDVQTVASAVLAHRMQADTTTGLSAASAAVAEMLTSVAVPSV